MHEDWRVEVTEAGLPHTAVRYQLLHALPQL